MEENNNVEELETVDGVFQDAIPEVEESLEIPEMTAQEADELKEQEPVENSENVEEGL